MNFKFASLSVTALATFLLVFSACSGGGGGGGAEPAPDAVVDVTGSAWTIEEHPSAGRSGATSRSVTGAIIFNSGGEFSKNGNDPDAGGDFTSGGVWSLSSDNFLTFHYTWYQYVGRDLVNYDGDTMGGTVNASTGTYTVKSQKASGWEGTISRQAVTRAE